jgi:hypothetical protein
LVGVAVLLGVCVCVIVTDELALFEGVCDAVVVPVNDGDIVCVGVIVTVSDGVPVTDLVFDGVTVLVAVFAGVNDALLVTVIVPLLVLDGVLV